MTARRPWERDWSANGTPQRWDSRLSPDELRARIDEMKRQLQPGTDSPADLAADTTEGA